MKNNAFLALRRFTEGAGGIAPVSRSPVAHSSFANAQSTEIDLTSQSQLRDRAHKRHLKAELNALELGMQI